MDEFDLPNLKRPDRRAILAICGGGFAGLFAAEVLVQLEATVERPLHEAFDLIAGTSVGGLLALGLADGQPAQKLSDLLAEVGPELFGYPRLGALKPKHGRAPLEKAADALFEGRLLSDLKTHVLIPAVDMTQARTVVFRDAPADPFSRMKIRDAALATSAAPFFLPPHKIGSRLFADGGLAANSPEALAASEAVNVLSWPAERTDLLVIGSTSAPARVSGHELDLAWGGAEWLKEGKGLALAMRAQMTLARETAESILGPGRVTVIDVELTPKEAEVISIDKATYNAAKALRTLGENAFDGFERAHLALLDRLRHG